MPCATVPPLLRPLAEICPHGIAINVANHCRQMRFFLNRERLESSLIKVPSSRGVMTGVPSHGVGVRQPSEKARHLVVSKRSNHKVPVVWQQTVGKNRKPFTLQRLRYHFGECFVIPRVLEQREPGNATVEHVVADSCGAEPRSARHFRTDNSRSLGYERNLLPGKCTRVHSSVQPRCCRCLKRAASPFPFPSRS